MQEYNNNQNSSNSWNGFTEGLAVFIKAVVKEAVAEAIQDKMYDSVVFDQKLTTKQLCERWNISDTTLLTWERKGIIAPIQTGGRKKIYSLKDIRDVEANGYVKHIA